jgi:hypothetical protein
MKDEFYNFADLLHKTKPLIKRGKTVDGLTFKWTETCWFRYEAGSKGKISVKACYNKQAPFKQVSLLRRGWKDPTLATYVEKVEKAFNPITEKKKEDLLKMLPLIDEEYHEFYQNLRTEKDLTEDVDYDLCRFQLEEEIADDINVEDE